MRPSFLIGIISSKEMGSGVSHSKIRLRLTITFGSHHFVITTLRLLIMPIQILIGVDRIRISHRREIQIGQGVADQLLRKLRVDALFVAFVPRQGTLSLGAILHPNLRPRGGDYNEEAPDTVNLVSLGVNPMSMHGNECTVQDNYKAFCVYANVHSLGNDQRSICLLRDSGASRSVASQGQLHQGEYIHTGEVRLIQGIVGQPVSVPLVEILIELNGRKQWILCGLVPSLPQDISVIIGNDYSNLLPVSVGVITRGMAS